jgi:hypothetical protein
MIVGGIQTVRTGDLGKGISAGLGAYGGANLTSGLMEAGASTISTPAAADAYASLGANAITDAQALTQGFGSAEELMQTKAALAGQEAVTTAGPFESLSKGFNAATANPAAMGQFAKDNWKSLAMAAGPAILAGMTPKDTMPKTVTQPGRVMPSTYDPISGRFIQGNPYEVPVKSAASGGIMGFDESANSPMSRQSLSNMENTGGMFNYAQDGGGVMRMAEGGIAHFVDGGEVYQNVANAYDPTKDDPATAMRKIQEAMNANKLLADTNLYNLQATKPTVTDLYSQYLNRAPEAGMEDYWNKTLNPGGAAAGDTMSYADTQRFKTAAGNELAANAGIAGLKPTDLVTGASGELAATPNNASATPNGGLPNLLANATGAGAAAPQLTPTQAAAEVNDMYRNVLGRDADPVGMAYWTNQIALGVPLDTLFNNFKTSATGNAEIVNQNFGNAAAAMADYKGYSSTEGGTVGDEWVRNVLGRELNADDRSQQWYRDLLDPKVAKDVNTTKSIYNDFKAYARSRDPLANTDLNWMAASQLKALPPPVNPTQQATQTVAKATGINTAPEAALPVGISGSTGPSQIGGGATVNPNGTITTSPVIPGIPVGGFTGMKDVRDAYTKGGGSLGYTPEVPKDAPAHALKYNKLTGGSKQAYDYLTGKTPYSATPYTPTGEVMKPYAESVLGIKLPSASKAFLFDPATKTYKVNPDYAIPTVDSTGKKTYATTNKDVTDYLDTNPAGSDFAAWVVSHNLSLDQVAAATGIPISTLTKKYAGNITTANAAAGNPIPFADLYQSVLGRPGDATGLAYWRSRFGDTVDPDELAIFKEAAKSSGELKAANGGLAALTMARGGTTHMPFFSKSTGKFTSRGPQVYGDGGMAAGGQFDLGSYSDGGRLLRGPGDGVSDSIPATIGNKRPARLADGEFVVPARIVSELGNGSTEAGARKLYAMMDRVQAARKGSIGRGKVANNSRADKYLPV